MRRNSFYSIAAALLMGAAAIGLAACTSEDNIADNQQPAAGEARTYTVSIPATLGGGSSQTRAVEFDNNGATPAIVTKFSEGERVYAYKKGASPALLATKNSSNGDWDGYLTVQDVSADGLSCNLKGDLTASLAVDDEIVLLYNLNYIISTIATDEFYYDYSYQTGTNCLDGATATVKVTGLGTSGDGYTLKVVDAADNTKTKADFTNAQAMFRLKFTDGSNPIAVSKLNIKSKNCALAVIYYPMNTSTTYYNPFSGITLTTAAAISDYFYVALCIIPEYAANDELTFTVTDSNGDNYVATKAAPAGGFKNGKYYYNAEPIAMTKILADAAPTITWTRPSTPVAANSYNIYDFNVASPNTYDITIANADGKDHCNGYRFEINGSGTVRLNNLRALWDKTSFPFLTVGEGGNLTVELTGTNSITCENANSCIYSSGNVKLSCTGTSATLTVTATRSWDCGIYGDTNYDFEDDPPTNNYLAYDTTVDVTSQLAADGFTVTRSARTKNAASTLYTWTYTVTKQ